MKPHHLLPLLVLAACGTTEQPAADPGKVSPPGTIERITAQETSFTANPVFDDRTGSALFAVYTEFAKQYPQDTMAPEYLLRAARLAKALRKPQESIALCDSIVKNYPTWHALPVVCMNKGITYQDELQDKEGARKAYEDVIARFPDHPYARDAKAMIDNLQYTDEELIARFKALNPDTGVVGR